MEALRNSTHTAVWVGCPAQIPGLSRVRDLLNHVEGMEGPREFHDVGRALEQPPRSDERHLPPLTRTRVTLED